VGETVGQDVLNLLTNFKTCSAKVTVTQLLTGAAIGYGIGVAGNALGGLLADAAEGEAGPAFGCGECFAAGTPVHTDNGAVPIERIKVGDKVWAHNEKTGVNELRTVTSVAPQHRDTLLELRIEGEKNALRATSVHPFYARRNASEAAHWINAGDLLAGEQIETQDGRWVAVQSVTPIPGLSIVYNFTVEEDHDYFVGDEGLLVHNAGPITSEGIQNIIEHLSRPELDQFGKAVDWPPNQQMLQRLQNGETTKWDQNYYEHEMIEKELMDQGMSYDAAHQGALARQGIPNEPGYQRELYHPEVIEKESKWFNLNCGR